VQVELLSKPFEFDSEQDQPFFFHSESGTYNATVPNLDIWKKFELLPTPPRTPARCESPEPQPTSVADTLQIVSEILDDTCSNPALIAPSEIITTSLKSKLIQDCMWNCSNFETLEFKVLQPIIDECYETPCSTPPPVEYDSSDCVDPAAVFPYPINDTTPNLGSSGSDSEEEIDVVTIEKPKKKNVNTATSQPPAKRLKPSFVRQKSTNSTHSSGKSTKRAAGRQTSDDEEEEEDIESKRATHNVLERKRRNDLKFSFHTLRDELPDVKENERAPKVVILRQGADYIEKLKAEEIKLAAELEKVKKRNQELLEKYSRLSQCGRKRKQH